MIKYLTANQEYSSFISFSCIYMCKTLKYIQTKFIPTDDIHIL